MAQPSTSLILLVCCPDRPGLIAAVTRFIHSNGGNIPDLIRKGRDLEKIVLSRALWHHLEHHVLIYGQRTVVFE